MAQRHNPPVYPAILRIGQAYERLALPDRVRYLSRAARRALVKSASLLGLHADASDFLKDETGRPLPYQGCYWSLSHKPGMAAAVIAFAPVGIDVETIRLRSDGLWARITDDGERSLFPRATPLDFFRCWTAKEAVLKAAGVGLSGLSGCRVIQVDGPDRLVVRYRDADHTVVHRFRDDHIISVAWDGGALCWMEADEDDSFGDEK